MRRKDREILDIDQLLSIINECKVCRIATVDKDGLYIVPLNFGYSYRNDKLELYFHSAFEGRKVSAFAANSKVAFEMDCKHELVEGKVACAYGYKFKSITGNGIISIIDNLDEKATALNYLMKHQAGKEFEFNEKMMNAVLVYKLSVDNFSGKEKK